jgi:hypothetical protein
VVAVQVAQLPAQTVHDAIVPLAGPKYPAPQAEHEAFVASVPAVQVPHPAKKVPHAEQVPSDKTNLSAHL